MSYSAKETSQYQGRPTELYRFLSPSERWLYTTADADVTYLGETYTALPAIRAGYEVSPVNRSNELAVELPIDNILAKRFRVFDPPRSITLDILRYHEGDGEALVVWSGRVRGCSWVSGSARLKCQPLDDALLREGPRYRYLIKCQHMLYDDRCGLNRALWARAGTVATISGDTITSAALGLKTDGTAAPDGWYTAGYVSRADEDYRFIVAHAGTSALLSAPFEGLAAGEAVTFFAGCKRSYDVDCDQKFANKANYGGFPYMPIRNPHEGF